jgi:hypothetical protein
MNQRDQIKVLNQEFTIIRERDEGMRSDKINVVCKTRSRLNWHLLKKHFPSKAARRRFMDNYLLNAFIIED